MNIEDINALLDNTATIETKLIILPIGDEEPIELTQDDSVASWEYADRRYVPDIGIIGMFVERTLEGSLMNITPDFNIENREIELQLGVRRSIDGEYTTTFYSLGNFIVSKPDSNEVKDNTQYKAKDYTIKFNVPFNGDYTDDEFTESFNDLISSGTGATAEWVARYTCKQVGVELADTNFTNSDFMIFSNQFQNGDQCRDVMKDIGKLAFSWVRIGWDNKCHIDYSVKKEVTEEYNNISKDNYYTLEIQKNTYGEVNKVVFGSSIIEGDYSFVDDKESIEKNGETALVINDNPILYTEELRDEAIKKGNVLFGLKYTPLTIETTGHPWLNGDDMISVPDSNDNILYSYPFDRVITYKGHIRTTLSTYAQTDVEQDYSYEGTESAVGERRQTRIVLDRANQNITALIEKTTDQDSKITKVEQDLDGITSTVSNMETKVEEADKKANDASTKVDGLSTSFNDFKDNEYLKSIQNLQDQIDGAIQFWKGNEVPTLDNYPASGWTTNEDKDNHLGDIYYLYGEDESGETIAINGYRFDNVDEQYQWILLSDTELAAVQKLAEEAKEKADSIEQNLQNNYSTTTEMNSAITQKANEITSSVNQTITQQLNDFEIGGTQILRGTGEQFTKSGSSGKWSDATWRNASGGNATKTFFTVTDSPNGNIKTGVRITRISSNNTSNNELAQDSVPVANGQTYTLSCYARKTSGDGTIRMQYGKSPYVSTTYDITDAWKQYSFTFTVGAKSDGSTGGNTNIYIGAQAKVGVVELCGFKLEKGNKATDWSPAPEDTDSKFNNYSTTTETNNTIDQKISDSESSIQASVGQQIKDAEGNIKKDVQGSIELKLDKKDLFTEFNVNTNQVVINSDNFTLTKEGHVEAYDMLLKGGKLDLLDDGSEQNASITITRHQRIIGTKLNVGDTIKGYITLNPGLIGYKNFLNAISENDVKHIFYVNNTETGLFVTKEIYSGNSHYRFYWDTENTLSLVGLFIIDSNNELISNDKVVIDLNEHKGDKITAIPDWGVGEFNFNAKDVFFNLFQSSEQEGDLVDLNTTYTSSGITIEQVDKNNLTFRSGNILCDDFVLSNAIYSKSSNFILRNPTQAQIERYDLNGNGSIDEEDVNLIGGASELDLSDGKKLIIKVNSNNYNVPIRVYDENNKYSNNIGLYGHLYNANSNIWGFTESYFRTYLGSLFSEDSSCNTLTLKDTPTAKNHAVRLQDLNNKVTYRDISIDKQFSIPSKSGVYEQFEFPTISGYTPVAINLLNVNGGANGLCVYSLRLQNPSILTIYNYGTGTASPYNVKIRVTYIKN